MLFFYPFAFCVKKFGFQLQLIQNTVCVKRRGANPCSFKTIRCLHHNCLWMTEHMQIFV